MTEHSVAHGTFVIERTYPHPVEKVWAAWSDQKKKGRWFGDPNNDTPAEVFEFRPGGRESSKGKIPNGPVFSFDVLYQDIIPLSRILYSYDMHMDAAKISVSLAAIEFWTVPEGTRMKLTEYGLFLDGLDNNRQRQEGTIALMEQLGKWLDKN
jgi:uncharacterized protein YndB with AHSA1/START domain